MLAGRGSGNTEVLAVSALRLLNVDRDPARAERMGPESTFLATFTEGAARNLEDRIAQNRAAIVAKDRKSNRLHRNIPSVRVPVKSQRKPRLSDGGSLSGRNRPAKGWRDGFSGGRWVGLWKSGNGGAGSPAGPLCQDTLWSCSSSGAGWA